MPLSIHLGDLGHQLVYVAHPPPFVAQMPPVFIPSPDPQLHTKIVNQIDYYFRYFAY